MAAVGAPVGVGRHKDVFYRSNAVRVEASAARYGVAVTLEAGVAVVTRTLYGCSSVRRTVRRLLNRFHSKQPSEPNDARRGDGAGERNIMGFEWYARPEILFENHREHRASNGQRPEATIKVAATPTESPALQIDSCCWDQHEIDALNPLSAEVLSEGFVDTVRPAGGAFAAWQNPIEITVRTRRGQKRLDIVCSCPREVTAGVGLRARRKKTRDRARRLFAREGNELLSETGACGSALILCHCTSRNANGLAHFALRLGRPRHIASLTRREEKRRCEIGCQA